MLFGEIGLQDEETVPELGVVQRGLRNGGLCRDSLLQCDIRYIELILHGPHESLHDLAVLEFLVPE